MIAITNIGKGIALYADRELLPKLQDGSWQKAAAGIAASIVAKRGELLVQGLANNQALSAMQIVKDGQVDLDLLRDAACERLQGSGMVINVPVLGSMTFNQDDVNKLYSCITEV